MSTSKLLQAQAFTGQRWNTTFDRWVKFCDKAWTPQWLDRHKTARFTEADMEEVGTFVQLAGQLLIALNHPKMTSLGIGLTFLDWAANLCTLVLLVLLELVANTLAF